MRPSTTVVLGLSALAVLSVTGCSGTHASPDITKALAATPGHDTPTTAPGPLSSAALSKRLLDGSDLGEDYTPIPQRPAQHDDVAVYGCPALSRLGGDTATGTNLGFPRKAKISFTYAGSSNSEMSEELYSGSASKLSKGVGEIFDAMVSCPTYQVVAGNTTVDMSTQQLAAPTLGDQCWSLQLTYSVGGQRTVVKQTAVRAGNILVIVSGSPGLVDAHLQEALDTARVAR